MKNIIATSALVLLLTSCGGKSSNIVSFTKPVSADASGGIVMLPAQHHLSSWDSNNVNVNIAIDPTHTKFKSHKLSIGASISVEPAIIDDKIFILTKDGYLTSLDKTSLEKLWSIDLVNKRSKSEYIGGGVTYHAGKLFVTNGSREFNIIDATNGTIVFSKQFPDLLITKPVIHNNLAILQTISNQVYMIDLGNNAIIWDHTGNPETLQSGVAIEPVIVDNGIAILSYTSGQVSLVDLNKRAEIWQMDLSADNTMPEYAPVNLAVSPIIDNKDAYLVDNNGKVFKVNIETGALIWKKDVDDVRTLNSTVNALIMTTNGRQVVALDKVSSKVLWTTYLDEQGKARTKWDPIHYVSSLIVNDILNIHTSTGELYMIDLASGSIIKRSNVGTKLGFVTITDKIRIFNGKKVLVSESRPISTELSFFSKIKTPKQSPVEGNIQDAADAKPAQKKLSWFKPFKFNKKPDNTNNKKKNNA